MTDRDRLVACSLAIDVVDDQVRMAVSMSGRNLTPVLSAAEARELAAMLRRAADIADAGGQPHGHA